MDPRYYRPSSPRRIVVPERASTGGLGHSAYDNYYTSSNLSRSPRDGYPSPRNSRERVGGGGVIPISTETYVTSPSTASTRGYVPQHSGGRPRRSTLTGDSSSTSTRHSLPQPRIVQDAYHRPSSPLSRTHHDRDKDRDRDSYVTPASSHKKEHKKIYSVDNGTSARLIGEIDSTSRDRDYRDRDLDRDRGRGRDNGHRRRESHYHLTGPSHKRYEVDEGSYSYTDAAGMYRDTEPRWRNRRGSVETGTNTRRPRPSSMLEYPPPSRASTARDFAGPPPASRGLEKYNESLSRAATTRESGRELPARSSSKDRYESGSYRNGDAYSLPQRTASARQPTTIHQRHDSRTSYDYDDDRDRDRDHDRDRDRDRRAPAAAAIEYKDTGVEARGFGIRPPTVDPYPTTTPAPYAGTPRSETFADRRPAYVADPTHPLPDSRDYIPPPPPRDYVDERSSVRGSVDDRSGARGSVDDRSSARGSVDDRERARDREYDREYDRERERPREKDRDAGRYQERDIPREREGERDRDYEREHEYNRERDRPREKHREEREHIPGAFPAAAAAGAAYAANESLDKRVRDERRDERRDDRRRHEDEDDRRHHNRRRDSPSDDGDVRDRAHERAHGDVEETRERDSRRNGRSEKNSEEVSAEEDYMRRIAQEEARLRGETAPREKQPQYAEDSDPEVERRRRERRDRERRERDQGRERDVAHDRSADDPDHDVRRRDRAEDVKASERHDHRNNSLTGSEMVQEPEDFSDTNDPNRRVRIVEPPKLDKEPSPPPLKGILRKPTEKFPEDPNPIREGVAPLKDAKKHGIPPGARWTKIDRRLVNPEALEEANERFEERLDCVIVLRVLTKEEIQKFADRTKDIRDERYERERRERKQYRLRDDRGSDEEYEYNDDEREKHGPRLLENAPSSWRG